MKIGIVGAAGRIGRALTQMALARGHEVIGADLASDGDQMTAVYNCEATVSFAPEPQHIVSAQNSFFDASEKDTSALVSEFLAKLDPDRLYVPNCGIAPGAVNIFAAGMLRCSPDADQLTIYCGALPADRKKGYTVTWSPSGLAGLYRRDVVEREDGAQVVREALSDLTRMQIGGEEYECFATAGGLGTLLESFPNVRTMAYRTLRYPGHREQIAAVLYDCAWHNKPLAPALQARWPDDGGPDTVVAYVQARGPAGCRDGHLTVLPRDGLTAIQRATAGGLLAAIEATQGMKGYVRQEQIPYERWLPVWMELTA